MLTIGEFSKLCMVTTKTLRHYDLIGLLKPAELNSENGYRYYSTGQLDVMLKIIRLKDYGFSLKEIKEIHMFDEAKLQSALERKLGEQKEILLKQAKLVEKLQSDISALEEGKVFMKTELSVKIVQTKPINVLCVRENIAIKDFEKLFNKLFALAESKNLMNCPGSPIAVYHSAEFNPENTDVELCWPVEYTGEGTRVFEGGMCANITHHGSYETLNQSYAYVAKWIEESGYKISCSPYEVYVSDPSNTAPEDLITEIYFPISRV